MSAERPAEGGLYQYYKGGVFELLHHARWDTNEDPLVVFQNIKTQEIRVRGLSQFIGTTKEGVKRFEFVGRADDGVAEE